MKKLIIIVLFTISFFEAGFCQRPSIGQRFILTLPHTNNTAQLKSWLQKTRPAGVMLESFHLQSRKETKKLTIALQAIAKKIGIPPLLIAVDWEPGIVSRPNQDGKKGDFFSIPSPYALVKAGRSACFLAGKLIGQQMRSVGITVDFAPSLDLFGPLVLATRCFSDNPDIVFECAMAFAAGLQSEGIIPVVKHFPGLGNVAPEDEDKDTHLKRVRLNGDKTLFNRHTEPFKKVMQKGLPCIMVTHAQCPQFGKDPATLSKTAVSYIKSFNQNAVIITDDFCMKAVQDNRSAPEAVRLALVAGFHLIIFSGTPREQENVIAELERDQDHSWQISDNAQGPVALLKKQLEAKHALPSIMDEKKVSRLLAERTTHVPYQKIPDNILLFSIDLPKMRPAESWFIENNQSYLASQLQAHLPQSTVTEHILNPQDPKSGALLEKYSAKNQTIFLQTFFYGQGIWNDNQKAWLTLLKPYQKNLTIFSLGHPFEKSLVPDARIIELGSFHKTQIEATVEQLCEKPLKTGADIFMKNPGKYLNNKRFGILCHQCSTAEQNGKQVFLPDLLYAWAKRQNNRTKLAALFAPEHGIFGQQEAEAVVHSESSSTWGCPVYSLHGKTKSPSPEMLRGLDVILIDFQEVGVRCFTYIGTTILLLREAARQKIPVIILNRPNPLYFLPSSGPELEEGYESLLGLAGVPFVHGTNLGAIAQYENETIGADLTVIDCQGSDAAKSYYFNHLKTFPSPNLTSKESFIAYPMTVFLEGTNYSEGRGTIHAFEEIGGPWVNKDKLARTLNSKKYPGVYFEPISFTPRAMPGRADNPKHKDMLCHGVFIHVDDPVKVEPCVIAKTILATLFDLYPKQSVWLKCGKKYGIDNLVGSCSWREEIEVN